MFLFGFCINPQHRHINIHFHGAQWKRWNCCACVPYDKTFWELVLSDSQSNAINKANKIHDCGKLLETPEGIPE